MLKCSNCKKPIQDHYIDALDGVWHPNCFRCAACNGAISGDGFIEKNGKPLHQECYHELYSPRCAGCGKPIINGYIRALDKLWHEEHFVCAKCGKPIGKRFFERSGKAYCKDDYLDLFGEKCALCHKSITGQSLVDSWGNKYCKRHSGDPQCFSCGRMIGQNLTDGGVRYKDGRIVCGICRKTAIDSDDTARKVFIQVQQTLTQILDMDMRIDADRLHLMDQVELDRASPKKISGIHPPGLTLSELTTINRAESKRSIKGIFALTGLPEEHLSAVLAHELGHAWLFMSRFPKLPIKVEEGICMLLEAFWLQNLDTPEAAYRLNMLEKNDDPVYGRGYHQAKRALSKRSFSRLLEYVKKNQRFPR
ncbi:MAG: protein DA1 [Anaerolineaceae bacterium]|nr:protein DA1 [Anaerolineaceae bacterium]